MGGLSLTAADQAAKHQARLLWEADRAQLMLRQPFLALLALQLDLIPVIDARLATAATDGERVFVNARFLLSLSPADRLFVLAHEVWHCAALHFLRQGDREQEVWNFACDHEVNALLESQGLTAPADAVLYPQWRGANAEAVYQWLLEHPEHMGQRPEWADQHAPLADADGLEGPFDPDFQPSSGSWEAWPERVVGAAQQVEQRQPGSLPAEIEAWVVKLRQPRLPWRELLARFVAETAQRRRQWMPPNRRYLAQGLYLPGWAREEELSIVVAVDTSGSTSGHIAQFLSELSGIASSFGIWEMRLLQCDIRITSDRRLSSQEPPDFSRMQFTGGGGTDFRPVFERLAAEPARALVYLTDGFGPAPQQAPEYPVLWVLTPGGETPADWGDVVQLPQQ